MPADPFRRACVVAGCPRPVTTRGKCAVHARQADGLRGLHADRHLGARLYQTPEWRALRAAVLAVRPLCECPACLAGPRRERADTVHHVRPHGGDPRVFFDPANLAAFASACHARLHRAARTGGDAGAAGEKYARPVGGLPRGRALRAASGFAKGVGAANGGRRG